MTLALINADELQEIAFVLEEVNSLLEVRNESKALDLLKSNSDLIIRNWQTVLSAVGISHNFKVLEYCLDIIMPRVDEIGRERLFRYLLCLDRTVELSGMYQIPRILSFLNHDQFEAELEKWHLTRLVIEFMFGDKIGICVLRRSMKDLHSHLQYY